MLIIELSYHHRIRTYTLKINLIFFQLVKISHLYAVTDFKLGDIDIAGRGLDGSAPICLN